MPGLIVKAVNEALGIKHATAVMSMAFGLSGVYGGGGDDLSWQLPVNHYTKAKISPTIVHPRPDAETSTWARNRLAPDMVPWRIPITVQGGSWPFEYKIISGPSLAAIGQHYGDSDYGVLNWVNPSIGTHSFTIRVRTQDYGRTSGSADAVGEYFITFTLTVADRNDTSKFHFMAQSGGNNANAGSHAAPWSTLAAFTAASTNGKQFFLRAGNYTTSVALPSLDLSNRAKVWVGYPGESVTVNVDGTSGKCMFLNGNDGYVGNIRTFGGNSSLGDYWHWVSYFGDRLTMFESICDGLYNNGTQGGPDSNISGFTLLADSNTHEYVSIINTLFQNFTALQNGGATILYATSKAIIENCTITNFSISGGSTEAVRTKGHCDYVTYRRIMSPATLDVGASVLAHSQGQDGGVGPTPNNNEICWCYARQDTGDVRVANVGTATYQPWTTHVYRNTFIGLTYWQSYTTPATMYVGDNVLLNDTGTANDVIWGDAANITITASNNITRTRANAATTVDANGLLLDSYLTSTGRVRGTCGHEVAA